MGSIMRSSRLRVLAGLALGAGLAGAALAQAPGAAADAAHAERLTLTMGELFHKGGWTMYPLVFTSILALAFILYFFVVLRSEQIIPRFFRKEVLAKINDGDMEGVREVCNHHPNPLAEVTLCAVDFLEANPGMDMAMLKDAMQGEGERQALFIAGPTQYLLDIAVISPMLGLLGTVLGLMNAFQVVALDLTKAKPIMLAGGVSEVLINTAFGLIIGIPAMAFYGFFRSKAARLIAILEGASTEVLAALIRKRTA